MADVDRVARMAGDADRADLVERLDRARARLLAEDVPVAVVGEFKQGKSTLVNALLRTEVCPVDVDVVTAVPTIVRYAPRPSVRVHPVDEQAPPIDVPFERLREYVAGGEADGGRLRAVEVRLDRRLLRGGLSLVDTPGVGGLDSAHGNLTLGALSLAHAALFVTDAAQELTAPEVEFLERAVERCPRVVCVLTKTDLHAEWRRIAELDRAHLERAGLSLPVVPVSSFLRMRAGARDSAALNAESGFPRLIDALRRHVLGGADTAAVAGVRRDLAFAVAQLKEQVGAERAAVVDPAAGAALADRLAEQTRRRQSLAAGSASWQTVLADGIQDLSTDVDHDLRERLRAMVHRGDAELDLGDPRDTWYDFKAWATREATAVAVDNLLVLVTRAEELAREVAGRFDLEYDSLDLDLPAPAAAVATVSGLEVRFDRSSVQQFLGVFTAARVTYGGLFMLGAFGSLLGLTLAAPVGVLGGLTVGRKLIRDERQRQVEQRRQQAKQELRRYVDDVGFVVGRDSRDAVRRTQRFLRDEFTARAGGARRSSEQALAAVRRTAGMRADDRTRRAEELDRGWRDLDRVAERVTADRGIRAVP
ncbi:dynamin family protein [Phytohabitans sp. LJ34]|uniref:dynamin family protein n=1 Tax=Phytohabitans sp. LJ34 TaxID=3452217 RepID=UPI003F88CCA6